MKLIFLDSERGRSDKRIRLIKSHVAHFAAEERRRSVLIRETAGASRETPYGVLVSPTTSSSWSASSNASQDDDEAAPPHQTRIVPSPMTILRKGNSDPFGSTIIPIDATVNDLLAFNRHFFEPFVMSMEKGRDVSVSYLNKMYQSSTEALHDERTVHATLARLAIIKAGMEEDQATRAVASRFMSEAYSTLRHEITASSMTSEDLAVRIFTLLSFELVARNHSAAATHARVLYKIFLDRRAHDLYIDPFLLNSAFFTDMMRSLLSWSRPIIILEQIVAPETLSPLRVIIPKLESLGMLPPDPASRLARAGVPRGRLLKEFSTTLLLFRVGAIIGQPDHKLFAESTVGAWAMAWAINFQRLHGVYCEAKDAVINGTGSVNMHRREAAIALAMLYWEISVANFDFIDPRRAIWGRMAPTWSPARRVLSVLQQCIEDINWQTEQGDAPLELRLWLLYVATLAEQTLVNIAGKAEGWKGDCNKSFVAQAIALGLWTWDEVVAVLQEYAYRPEVSELSRPWFERCQYSH